MSQQLAIWVLIVLSLIGANLPFFIERPLLFLPWQQKGELEHASSLRLIRFILFSAILFVVGWFMHLQFSQLFFSNAWQLLGAGLVCTVLASCLFAIPAWLQRKQSIQKSFFARLLELSVIYGFVGIVGIGFEASLGNVFPQGWEFYAITYSLFLILGYPGFVIRYLLKRRRVLVSLPKGA